MIGLQIVTRAAAVILATFLVAACATTPEQRALATQRLEATWTQDNNSIRSALGQRTVKATPDQAYRAARAAFPHLGLELIDTRPQPLTVTAEHLFPQSSFSWTPAIRQAEEPRARDIFVQTIGPLGANLRLTLGDEILTGVAQATPAGKEEAVVKVDFQSRSPGGCPTSSCVYAMPPTALRAALYQFWTAFDEELKNVRAEDEARAEATREKRRSPTPVPARKPRKSAPKPPSDWVLPPSGWKPPPKGD